MTSLLGRRPVDPEYPYLRETVWIDEERIVWNCHTGYSVVSMTHRINVKLEAELVRLGRIA